LENISNSLTVKEVAVILRCSKAHALNVIEGRSGYTEVAASECWPSQSGQTRVARRLDGAKQKRLPAFELIRNRQMGIFDSVAVEHDLATTAAAARKLDERPLTVRDAASYLGVSPQTVYLWVERKQIPHLRVMGRNIRFLKSDLEPFRATFKQEVGYGTTNKE
jgi:excisionase family DNA binding protein